MPQGIRTCIQVAWQLRGTSSVAILAQEQSRSKWTLWQCQTTCFTGFLLISGSKCLQPSFLCFRASLFVLFATDRASEDAMRTSLPGSPPFIFECWFSSRFWSGPRWNGHPLRKYHGWKARCPSLKICTLRNADRSNSCSHDMDVPYGFTYLENTWDFDSTYRDGTEIQCPHRTYVQVRDICCLSIKCFRFGKILAYTRPSWQLHSRRVPWPRVIWWQQKTHDEGLILPQAQKMNNHEVPFYSDSLANNTSKELHSGSMPFGKKSDMLACNKPVGIHCKLDSVSVRLLFYYHSASIQINWRPRDWKTMCAVVERIGWPA